MKRNEAIEMAELFGQISGFTTINVCHCRQYEGQNQHDVGAMSDDNWYIELWFVSTCTDSRLMIVQEFGPEITKALSRKAKGKATSRDWQTFASLSNAI